MLQKLIAFQSGKKAYITGILMIILGFQSGNNELILQGIGLITLRLGIAKTK